MSELASEAAQRVILAALDGVISCPVYDEPPQDATFPYVTIGDAIETKRNTFGKTGRDVLASIDVWSRSGPDASQDGYGEALGIGSAIDVILDGYDPGSIFGWVFVSCDFEQQIPMRDPDGVTRHVHMEYRLRVER